MNVGQAIKKLRETAGYSQLELALQMGEGLASPSDISRIENGKQWPSKEKLEAISEVFGCPISELFSDDAPPNSEPYMPPLSAEEQRANYIVDSDDSPSIDKALKAVNFELPAVDPKTQAILAVEIYKAHISKQSADRIVSAINSLTMAVEQARDR